MTDTFLYGAHVRANGIRQHYLRYGGKGRPLIVIPGITSPAATWRSVGERLGHKHDTYVLDVRGRGLSETGPALDYGLNACAQDVAAFATSLQMDSYRVLGHSMGGRIAARLGHLYGTVIDSLVLVDPPLSGPGRRPYVRSLADYLEPGRKAQSGLLTADDIRRSHPTWTEEQLWARAEWLHTCDETAIRESVRSFQDEEIHSDFAGLRMPTLLMAAGKGNVITDEDVTEIRALMPSVRFQRIENAGHQVQFDNPGAFFAALHDFWEED